MTLRSKILKLACMVGLLSGFWAQAQVPQSISQVTTFFVPAMALTTVYGSLEGVYIELRPNGKFVSAEIEGHEIGGCEGSYGIQENALRLVIERCGILVVLENGDIGLTEIGLREATYLVTQEIILKSGSFLTPIYQPEIFDMHMNMLAARPNGPALSTRTGKMLGHPGGLMLMFQHLANH